MSTLTTEEIKDIQDAFRMSNGLLDREGLLIYCKYLDISMDDSLLP